MGHSSTGRLCGAPADNTSLPPVLPGFASGGHQLLATGG